MHQNTLQAKYDENKVSSGVWVWVWVWRLVSGDSIKMPGDARIWRMDGQVIWTIGDDGEGKDEGA